MSTPAYYVAPPTADEVRTRARQLGRTSMPTAGDMRSARMMLGDEWRKKQAASIRHVLTQPMSQGELQHVVSIMTYMFLDDWGY